MFTNEGDNVKQRSSAYILHQEALAGHTYTHMHAMKRQTDDKSPLATRLGNLPNRQQIDRVTAHRCNCNVEE